MQGEHDRYAVALNTDGLDKQHSEGAVQLAEEMLHLCNRLNFPLAPGQRVQVCSPNDMFGS